jgi:hypothetical protein
MNMMLRRGPDLAELLAAVAEVEGRPASDVAREAIAALDAARQDPVMEIAIRRVSGSPTSAARLRRGYRQGRAARVAQYASGGSASSASSGGRSRVVSAARLARS